MDVFAISQEKLCVWMWSNRHKQKCKIDILMNKIESEFNFTDNQLAQIKQKLNTSFLPVFTRYWNNSNRLQRVFKKRYIYFTEQIFKVVFKTVTLSPTGSSGLLPSTRNSALRGRPRLTYENCSNRTKRRRVQELRCNYDQEALVKAVTSKINEPTKKCTIDEKRDFLNTVLAMYMDLGMSKAKYENLRSYHELLFNDKSYPPYEKLRCLKKDCYPDNITITERGASVHLQSLLDHTVYRIISSLELFRLNDINEKTFILHGKWGMDGASGQLTVKQRWSVDVNNQSRVIENNTSNSLQDLSETEIEHTEEGEDELSDRAVFIISFVPLKIISVGNDILWINERPSSVRYCRPIKFEFIKETPSITLQEYNFYTEEIRRLVPTVITKNDITLTVTHDIKCTMIDGKVCNILTDQKSSASCNICGAKPNQMNNLNLLMSLKENKENYKFGLSTLHCWIRFMECILHIAYNMDFKKGYASGQNKILKQNKKKKIQRELKSQLSISVDIVKQGYGTTNDGNTARRFFEQPEKVAKILDIDINLITKFGTILQILSCGLEVDLDKFEKYTNKTAKLFVQHYNWYKMPPAVHKVLIHGRQIMEEFSIPIGHLSEEAQEANNKIFKNARAHNSRFCSRIANNEDTMHFLLISSDPLISAIRLKKDKKVKELTQEAKQLLKNNIYDQEIL